MATTVNDSASQNAPTPGAASSRREAMLVPDSAGRQTGTSDLEIVGAAATSAAVDFSGQPGARSGREGITQRPRGLVGRLAEATEIRAGEGSGGPSPASDIDDVRVQVHSARDVRVTIESGSPEPWTQVLNSFIDNHMPKLSESHLRIMLVFFRRRDRISGVARIARAELLSATGLRSKGTISDALQQLEDSGLIEPAGRDEWFVMPGRTFAGGRVSGPDPALQRVRPDEPPPLESSPRRTKVRPGEQKFAQANERSKERARRENQESKIVVDDDGGSAGRTANTDQDIEACVRMLTTPGPRAEIDLPFSPDDARHLVIRTAATPDRVRTALRNASHQALRNRVTSWRGYVRRLIENGTTLFDQIERQDQKLTKVVHAIRTMCQDGSLAGDELEQAMAWWERASDAQRACLISPQDLANRTGIDGIGRDRWLTAVRRAIAH